MALIVIMEVFKGQLWAFSRHIPITAGLKANSTQDLLIANKYWENLETCSVSLVVQQGGVKDKSDIEPVVQYINTLNQL